METKRTETPEFFLKNCNANNKNRERDGELWYKKKLIKPALRKSSTIYISVIAKEPKESISLKIKGP